MARVLYSAEINELKGSIGGTTFQRNNSGTISKLKTSLTRTPSGKQNDFRLAFASLSRLWAATSYENKVLWNSFALANTKFSYWNVEKVLTGFNWFVHINQNRLVCGQSIAASPPVYAAPLFCPEFSVYTTNAILEIDFPVFADKNSYYLFVYCTPPIRQLNLQSRQKLRLVSIASPTSSLYHAFTSAFVDYFNISWPPSSSSGDFNLLCAVSAVDSTTFIAGQFYLVNKSFST